MVVSLNSSCKLKNQTCNKNIVQNAKYNSINNSNSVNFRGEGNRDVYRNSNNKNNGVKKLVIATTIIGLGILTFWKRKNIKNFFKELSNNKRTPEVPQNTSQRTGNVSGSLSEFNREFTNLNEAKNWLENNGIEVLFKDNAENHLADLNGIKDHLYLLEKSGVAIPKPKSIIISDWHNLEELKEICRLKKLPESKANHCYGKRGYWGTISKSTDNNVHVLINSSFSDGYKKFAHEMGHVHQDCFGTSYWHSKGLNKIDCVRKHAEILGISDFGVDEGYKHWFRNGYELTNLFNITSNSEGLKEMYGDFIFNRGQELFKNCNPDKIFVVIDKNSKLYYINATKMVDKMASESQVYAPNYAWENVAEIFQGLVEGEKYSDLVMLMYDINGGGRIPNLVIKGMKYDDYMKSLYENKDLVRQLRECIEVKPY